MQFLCQNPSICQAMGGIDDEKVPNFKDDKAPNEEAWYKAWEERQADMFNKMLADWDEQNNKRTLKDH
jgi:hypothetical protein